MGPAPEQIEEKKPEIIEFAGYWRPFILNQEKHILLECLVRLAFACAINVDPDILIVDEVLSVGDMALQLNVLKKFEQSKEKENNTFVTHNISDT